MLKIAFVLLTLALGGCEIFGVGGSCESYLAHGIALNVTDSTSGAAPSADRITAVATDRAYADTVHTSGTALQKGEQIRLVEERPGTYRVKVLANGYAEWIDNEVSVQKTADGCHVKTVHLTVRLQRL